MCEIDQHSADRIGRAVEYHRSGKVRARERRQAVRTVTWAAALGFGLGVALNWQLMWRPVLGMCALAVAVVWLYRLGTRGFRSARLAVRVALYRWREGLRKPAAGKQRRRAPVIPFRGRP